MRWFPRLFDSASTSVPDGPDLEQLIQRRMYWFGVCFMTALVPIYGTLAVVRNTSASNWSVLGGVFGALAVNIWRTRRHRDFGRGLTWLHGVTFVVMLAAALRDVSVASSSFWWLTVIPFVAILSGNTRLGIAQGGVVVAYVLAAYLRESPPLDADAARVSVRLHLAVALSTVYACAYLALATMWRRELQQALHQAGQAATAAAEAKARFLANMSHEIRTPLNGVIGAAELLRSGRTHDAQRAQLVALQEQSAKTLLALINDVLDWSKLDAGKVALEARPLYLRGLVFESNELFAVSAFDKGIELTSSCNPDVPRRFVGDATRIRQIVNNLVSNAVKFTERGGVHVHLALGGGEVGDPPRADGRRWVRVEVADSGIGIPAENQAGLFDAFRQADTSVTRKYGGTGLGLSICTELARLMGGRIEVSSTPGHGSTFTLVVPLQVAEEQDPAGAPQRRGDVLLASASPGLIRHVGSLLHELQIEPDVSRGLPREPELVGRRLLLVDAPLLAELADARAWIEARAAGGTRIVVMAPLNADALLGTLPEGLLLYKPVRRAALVSLLDVAAESGDKAEAPVRQPNPPPLRVLLCEDNPVNQIIVQAMLADLGASCTVAANGVEAIACLSAEGFDLALMDIQMPELDGMAATHRWRAIEAGRGTARLPIVAMTANSEGEEGAACRAAGLDGFLAKPFGVAALRHCLHEYGTPQQPAPRAATRA
jgi:two-component system sensor histidine kinase BarA